MIELLREFKELVIIAILCNELSQVEAKEFREKQEFYEVRIFYGNSKSK